MTIEQAILDVVTEHSGGLKMLELIVELMTSNDIKLTSEELESTIAAMPQLGILEYAGPTYGEIVRVKQFVYRLFE